MNNEGSVSNNLAISLPRNSTTSYGKRMKPRDKLADGLIEILDDKPLFKKIYKNADYVTKEPPPNGFELPSKPRYNQVGADYIQ